MLENQATVRRLRGGLVGGTEQCAVAGADGEQRRVQRTAGLVWPSTAQGGLGQDEDGGEGDDQSEQSSDEEKAAPTHVHFSVASFGSVLRWSSKAEAGWKSSRAWVR